MGEGIIKRQVNRLKREFGSLNQLLKGAILVLLTLLVVSALSVLVSALTRNKPPNAEPRNEGELPQWFLDWLDAQDANHENNGELSLSCTKTPAGKGEGPFKWNINCKKNKREGDDKEDQANAKPLKLRMEKPDSIGKSNKKGESCLCCRACSNATIPIEEEKDKNFWDILLQLFRKVQHKTQQTAGRLWRLFRSLFRWHIDDPKTEDEDKGKKPEEPKVDGGLKCKYHSETKSIEIEEELKQLLRKELLRLVEQEAPHQDKPCLDEFPTKLHTRFSKMFENILHSEINQLSDDLKARPLVPSPPATEQDQQLPELDPSKLEEVSSQDVSGSHGTSPAEF
ncbi:conserved hypothetical protein [Ricinus communis]|uniref:Uncharacterized protein n=2 Tax=Ricinus communis TaxID=3988 RepID=B9RVN0_RICCO|nr:conserved hypothetical protein [Ricinus communis]|eukprot:XP_002517799.1 uncharacterized protein LOC8259302 [Ricinus communis]